MEDDGAIAVDEGAADLLAGRPGRFRLARTTPDLLVAIRPPDEDPNSSIGHVALCGDLDGTPFSDVVTMLSQGRRSGSLHVLLAGIERVLWFSGGNIVAASSTRPGERLGEVAMRLGLVERADLANLLSRPSGGRSVGQRLVERGLVDRSGLAKAVREQIAVVFDAILLRPAGTFYFRDRPVPPGEEGATIPAHVLLLDGLRRLDEWTHYRGRIPSSQAQVRLVGAVPPPLEDPIERICAERLRTGAATVDSLSTSLRLPEAVVVRALYALAKAGVIEVRPDRKARPLAGMGTATTPLLEILGTFNRLFSEIFTEVDLTGEGESFRKEALEALHGEASRILFGSIEFGPDGTLPEGEVLDRLPEAAQATGKGPRALLLESLEPVLEELLRLAEKRLDPAVSGELHARVRILFGGNEW